jgi:murein DD-endopeptidase MepM/ murein hydrolase activator NlpD
LRQFYSPRRRIFRNKRRWGLRRIVFPLLAALCLYAAVTRGPSIPVAPVVTASYEVPAGAVILPPAPNPVAEISAAVTLPSPKLAPKLAPVPPSTGALSGKLASIEKDISDILQSDAVSPDAPPPAVRPLIAEKKVAVGKGDTLMELLVKNKVPREEAWQAIEALRKIYDPRNLYPGREITVFFHKDPSVADPKFSGLQIERDTVNTVVVHRGPDGDFKVGQEEKEVHRTLKGFKGKIDSSLYVSAKAHSVPDAVILDLIKMYSWNVDFQRDIQPGDAFDVMYEEYVTEDGDIVSGRGNIVYAKLTLSGRQMPFYRYEDQSGDVDYYDEEGHSAKRPLMKTPIDGARISSGFGMRRHPVLGYSKMHKGMDFAAPRGTPVYAAGDGVIEKLGRFSSYGNYIRIRHKSDLKTAYAHLNGYKAGLKSGSRIKQGQVIGYVGTTGRSTGPHLHYEVLVSSRQVNPNSIKLPTGKALAGKDLNGFKIAVADVNRQFSRLDRPAAVASRN